MPRRLKLTWQANHQSSGGRWKKVYRGKAYYFVYGTSKSDRAGYDQALLAWEKKKAEVDALVKPEAGLYLEAIKSREELAEVFRLEGDIDNYKRAEKELRQLRRWLELRSPPPINSEFGLPLDPLGMERNREHPQRWSQITWGNWSIVELRQKVEALRLQRQWAGGTSQEKELSANAGRYLAGIQAQAGAGECTLSYYSLVNEVLQKFVRFVGGTKPVEAITAPMVSAFTNDIKRQVGEGKLSRSYASAIAKKSRAFIRWLWRQEILEHLPRNLDEMRVKVGSDKVPTMTVPEVQALLAKSKGRRPLWWLLMLNCGFTQGDIAKLKETEVNWKEGTIKRKRSKTANHENVPEVTYKLWPETFALLKKYRATGSELALLNKAGKPLVYMKRTASGRVAKSDSIAKSARKMHPKVYVKRLRKTSSALLEKHEHYGRYVDYFLGHAPRSLADKHYRPMSDEVFFQALDWLRQQYNIG